jgi:parallel beta-helix repeat protein
MHVFRLIFPAMLLATGLLAPAPAAFAAQSYDNCTGFIDSIPATITTQGTWCLRKDVASSAISGQMITLGTNNVTIDCNHFKIGGLGGGVGTQARGIYASSRLNLTVRNCNIRGFYYGIYASGGGGHVIADNTFDGNTYVGILVYAAGSTIQRNIVVDTGGSTVVTTAAYGIYAGNGVDVLENTVNGVAASGANASSYGIYTDFNSLGSADFNRVRGLASAGSGSVHGIYNLNSGRTIVRGNNVQGNGSGVVGSTGIRCFSNQATARDNVVHGFATPVDTCASSSNFSNNN